ncbi:head decoration protein [Sinorhizobium americanum]|uniref:Bacteriophage lambda head decoration protein D n=1 Tax=Sinorhizobium americanum TaxID=194963 RepID=A0A4R2BRR9_9HYPH|nr:head decoration protein [Sinorhizobium americanum]TCN30331.1 bacteriophage lambda head decoration protein D [Sinorhizobium americanum]
MPVFTEAAHTAEFILSEANGHRSRESGTLASGQDLAAGTVLQDNGAGKLVAFDADTNTAGDLVDEAVGILLAAGDASDGDIEVAYIARDAEVNLKLLTYPAETTAGGQEADTIASLKLLGIIARD